MTRHRSRSRRAPQAPAIVPPSPHARSLKTVTPLHRRIGRLLRAQPRTLALLALSCSALAAWLLAPAVAATASKLAGTAARIA